MWVREGKVGIAFEEKRASYLFVLDGVERMCGRGRESVIPFEKGGKVMSQVEPVNCTIVCVFDVIKTII